MAEKEGGKACMEKSAQLLFTPDLINFWLTGERGNEITMASTSQMLNQKTRNWDFELLDQLKLPTNFLGQLWEPGHLVGMVSGAAKKRMQCENLPVYTVGSHDTASAVAGVPAVDGKDFAYLSSGTWSLMGVENEEPLCDSRSEELDLPMNSELMEVFGTSKTSVACGLFRSVVVIGSQEVRILITNN